MATEDLSLFCCVNPDCRLLVRRNAGNLLIADRQGTSGHQLLNCLTRKDRFSKFNGTPLFNPRLRHD